MIGIEHTGIFCKDSIAMKNWYMMMFGFKCVYDNRKGTFFLKADNEFMIELCTMSEDSPEPEKMEKGIRHLAISTDSFDELADKILQSGVQILDVKATAENGIKTLFFKDIEGNILHLISRSNSL